MHNNLIVYWLSNEIMSIHLSNSDSKNYENDEPRRTLNTITAN
jgi:hypothetical protein